MRRFDSSETATVDWSVWTDPLKCLVFIGKNLVPWLWFFISAVDPVKVHGLIYYLWLWIHCRTSIHGPDLVQVPDTWTEIGTSAFQSASPHPVKATGKVPLKLIVSAGPDHTHVHTQTDWINVKTQIKAINMKHTVPKL